MEKERIGKAERYEETGSRLRWMGR